MSRMVYKKRRRLIFGLLGMTAIVLASFMFMATVDADLYVQPSEISKKSLKIGDSFRVGGMVATGSYSKASDGLTHLFEITDCAVNLKVEFKGMIPSLFREGQGVIAEGKLSASNQFTATRVLAKHDEKYEAKGTRPKTDAFKDGVCTHPDANTAKYK